MQKIKYDKIVFLALGLILMALVIQMAILNWINNKNTAKMSEVLLDRVVNVIEKNEDDEKNMITSLKEDYIVRAKAVVYAALDVNGLKGINDTLGHNAGDELIQGAAGMDAHIIKPVNESKLKECMVRLLASR